MNVSLHFYNSNTWPDYMNVTINGGSEVKKYFPERTCRNEDGWCSKCDHFLHDGFKWCPWCGAKVVSE